MCCGFVPVTLLPASHDTTHTESTDYNSYFYAFTYSVLAYQAGIPGWPVPCNLKRTTIGTCLSFKSYRSMVVKGESLVSVADYLEAAIQLITGVLHMQKKDAVAEGASTVLALASCSHPFIKFKQFGLTSKSKSKGGIKLQYKSVQRLT